MLVFFQFLAVLFVRQFGCYSGCLSYYGVEQLSLDDRREKGYSGHAKNWDNDASFILPHYLKG